MAVGNLTEALHLAYRQLWETLPAQVYTCQGDGRAGVLRSKEPLVVNISTQ